MVKKQLIMMISIAVLFALSACAEQTTTEFTGQVIAEPKLEEVSVRLPIPVQDAAFTPFFAAIDQGYYKEQGLDVTFHFGSSETNPVKMVATGADDFGVLGGPDTLLVARSKGQDIKAFALMHQDSDFSVIVTRADSGIDSVDDLEGKKLGFNYGHISTDIIRNNLRKEGVSVEEVDVGFDFSQLITGKVDAQFGFRTHAPMHLREQGVEVTVINPRDYGVSSHGYTIFATDETLDERAELAEKFWKATAKGIEYTKQQPEEALKSILSRSEKLKKDVELEKLALYSEVIKEPYGHMTEEMFQETYDRLAEEDVIDEAFDITDSFTLDIMERIYE